jgi:ribonuclease E
VAGATDIATETGAQDEEDDPEDSAEPSTTPLLLGEDLADAPTAVAAEPASRPPAKPKIGDTRPGSPPVTKRRVRKDTGPAGARMADAGTAGDATVEDDPEEPEEGDAGTPGARARRSRRRRSEAGETGAQGAMIGPAAVTGPTGPAGMTGPGATTGSPDGDKAVAGSAAAVGPSRDTATVGRAARGGSGQSTWTNAAYDRAGAGDGGPRRAGNERTRRPLGRYLMVVHVGPTATQIAVLEGRTLIEHYVSRPADDATQIDGNIYLGRVQNVLPGMEAAFVDIGTPKNAVLYRGDLRYDDEEVERPASDEGPKPTRGRLGGAASDARIEQLLRTGQSIICQVTKNPIGTKGARLTQEVSLPGRFVVLIPDSETYGISKRLGDDERRRLRKILDDVRPEGHGLIVRTAAEGASADELGRDVSRLLRQWEQVQELAKVSRAPQLLYREPDLAVRVIREEFNRDYRGVVIDDRKLYDEVKEYVTSITPELAERVELVGPGEEPLPLFERFRVHEQVHKALDRKVWLPSGGSIIIERTEALTVIDVNTGKNVGTSNLEETVFRNNLEAAEEIARQLRLRDIGGIIVIDFIDMDVAANRAEVIRTFREALARDKTRSQVFDISELGLVEMTRKRISEGLVESYSETCPTCGGRGIVFDESLL